MSKRLMAELGVDGECDVYVSDGKDQPATYVGKAILQDVRVQFGGEGGPLVFDSVGLSDEGSVFEWFMTEEQWKEFQSRGIKDEPEEVQS